MGWNRILFTCVAAGAVLWLGSGRAMAMASPPSWESNYGTELTDLTGQDDAEQQVDLSFLFPFAGSTYDSITVSTNGVVGLGGGDYDYEPTANGLLNADQPTLAPFWSDMSLEDMGNVYFNDFGDRAAVSWIGIGAYESEETPFNFQLQLHDHGEIVFGYRGISDIENLDEDLLVGVSPGDGASDPGEHDFNGAFLPFVESTVYEIFGEGGGPFDLDQQAVHIAPPFLQEGGYTAVTTAIPEPASLALLGLGGMVLMRRRRRHHA